MSNDMNMNTESIIKELVESGSEYISIDAAMYFLRKSRPRGFLVNYDVASYFCEIGGPDETVYRVVIAAQHKKGIAACAIFTGRLNGKIWQLSHATTYPGFTDTGIMYKIIDSFRRCGTSFQSRDITTDASNKFWSETLPKYGLNPMIFDTETEYVMNPKTHMVTMYPQEIVNGMSRYAWVLHHKDSYSDHCMIDSGLLGRPYTGFWHSGKLPKALTDGESETISKLTRGYGITGQNTGIAQCPATKKENE